MKSYLLLALLPLGLLAQNTIPGGWMLFLGNIPLKNDAWQLFTDVQLRDKQLVHNHDQMLLRLGLTRKINAHYAATIGFANILFYADELPLHEPRMVENRYWAQMAYTNDWGNGRYHLRYRFELRDLEGAVPFRSRLRVQGWQPLPTYLNYKNRFRVHAYNELFVNTQGSGWQYDRNRLYVSLGYKCSHLWEVQMGGLYQDVRQIGAKGYIQLGVFYN